MSFRKFLLGCVAVVVALFLGALLYLTFGDLSRHKPRLEAFVTDKTGRSFRIEGPFTLRVLPELVVEAEGVRLGNAEWGSTPEFVEVGRFSTVIDVWSLFSGPVEIRSLEVRDVEVLLETGPDGKANWVLTDPAEAEEAAPPEETGAEVPLVIEQGSLDNIRVTYREPGKEDRVALLQTLQISPAAEGLLALSGEGQLNEYPVTLQGDVGPVKALVAGKDLRMAIEASIGNLSLAVDGGIGRLNPLDGADLRVHLGNPDVGTMLKNLQLPEVATGTMQADLALSDAGERTGLELDATLGDIHAAVSGSLATLGLTGSDLTFEGAVGDAARLAAALGIEEGVPEGELKFSGHVSTTSKEFQLDGVKAALAGAAAQADGTMSRSSRGSNLQLAATIDSLANVRPGSPEIPVKASATYVGDSQKAELQTVRVLLGETEISGWARVMRTGRRNIEAEITSPHLDLTAFGSEQEKAPADKDEAPAPETSDDSPEQDKKFVFSEKPLPLEELDRRDAQLRLQLARLTLEKTSLSDVSGTLTVSGGRLAAKLTAKGPQAGTIDGVVQLVPSEGSANVAIKLQVNDLRLGLLTPEGEDASTAPPLDIDLDVSGRGTSARQVASGANGRMVVTQGAGHVKAGVIDKLGSGVLSQVGAQLNPFAEQDAYTSMECTVVQAEIVDGQTTIDPVLMQSEKVTIVGKGAVDLKTEALTFEFTTRPRKGIGISPGMFTNPFVQLGGTLAHPRLATGAKGTVAGAAAVGTAGLSIVAKGLVDRLAGAADLCPDTLAEVAGEARPPGPAEAEPKKVD